MATREANPPVPRPRGLLQTLTLWDVVTMNVVAVVTLRWITRAARMGPASLALWAVAWLVFFVPLASAVMELSSRYPAQGGIYAWTRRAFGPTHGFICGWCLWVNNLFYFPSMLLFAGANALLVLGAQYEALADTHLYSTIFVLATLWGSAVLGVAGFRAGRWLSALGALAIWIPAGLLVTCGAITLATSGSATSFALADIVPRGEFWGTLSLWSGVCFAFSGFEVTTLVGQEVRQARRTIPRGVFLGGLLATVIYTAGTAAVLVAIPIGSLSERTGLADVVSLVAGRVGLGGLSGVAGGLLALGMIAGSATWFASAGRVPFAVGEDGGFPRAFTRLHPRFRTPHVALVAQGFAATVLFLVSVFLTVAGARTTVQEAYDILVNLTILVYFVPYLYLFLALVKLRAERTDAPEEVHVPGGRRGVWLMAGAGAVATAISLALTFVPPAGTENVINYEVNIIGQTAALVACGLAVLWWAKREAAR